MSVYPATSAPEAPEDRPGRGYSRLIRAYRIASPWLSLGMGVVSVAFSEHSLGSAPTAAALLAMAWVAAALLARRTRQPLGRLTPVADMLTASLYQNALFFSAPVWLASATWSSLNILLPVALSGMAVLSCFDASCRRWILDRRTPRTVWSAVALFAVAVPAVCAAGVATPRASAAVSGAAATLLASGAMLPGPRSIGWRDLARVVLFTAAGAALPCAAAPMLPPVPVTCATAGIGTAVVERKLQGEASSFPAGTSRIAAWFAIALPAGQHERVQFVWRHDGELVGHVQAATVAGTRRHGYRVWAWRSAPAPGRWRVDLLTEHDQLIARRSFVVYAHDHHFTATTSQVDRGR